MCVVHYMSYIIRRTMYVLHYNAYIIRRTIYDVHYTAYIVRRTYICTLYNVYNIHCTTYTVCNYIGCSHSLYFITIYCTMYIVYNNIVVVTASPLSLYTAQTRIVCGGVYCTLEHVYYPFIVQRNSLKFHYRK